MASYIVKGGNRLSGEVTVSGSKNAALPILCASLLSKEPTTLENVPDIEDIHSMIRILEDFGAKIEFSHNTLRIDPEKIARKKNADKLVEKMRASILIIGALIPRFGEVEMAFPGGCVLGKRSVSAHTYALQELGCKIIDDKKGIHIKCGKLKGAKIVMPELSVTATENAVMAAVMADGETEIRLAAAEPHVQDLCRFLNKMGAKITGIGTNILNIRGVKSLKGTKHKIIGDYLEAGTFAIAAAVTNSTITIKGIDPHDLDSFWQKFKEIGVKYELGKDSVKIISGPSGSTEKHATDIRTAVYPSFPTDLQAPFTVLLTQANGKSKVFETLFEGRLNYLFELEKMGANIELINPHQALINGPSKLKGIPISSCDIRAGAAMVLAALVADGITEISNIYYIDRGYENFEEKLLSLGADIRRE